MSATHALVSTTFVPAVAGKNIDGYVARCACGFSHSTSLSARFAERDLLDHVAYMARIAR